MVLWNDCMFNFSFFTFEFPLEKDWPRLFRDNWRDKVWKFRSNQPFLIASTRLVQASQAKKCCSSSKNVLDKNCICKGSSHSPRSRELFKPARDVDHDGWHVCIHVKKNVLYHFRLFSIVQCIAFTLCAIKLRLLISHTRYHQAFAVHLRFFSTSIGKLPYLPEQNWNLSSKIHFVGLSGIFHSSPELVRMIWSSSVLAACRPLEFWRFQRTRYLGLSRAGNKTFQHVEPLLALLTLRDFSSFLYEMSCGIR